MATIGRCGTNKDRVLKVCPRHATNVRGPIRVKRETGKTPDPRYITVLGYLCNMISQPGLMPIESSFPHLSRCTGLCGPKRSGRCLSEMVSRGNSVAERRASDPDRPCRGALPKPRQKLGTQYPPHRGYRAAQSSGPRRRNLRVSPLSGLTQGEIGPKRALVVIREAEAYSIGSTALGQPRGSKPRLQSSHPSGGRSYG